jgi:hypothetical protein
VVRDSYIEQASQVHALCAEASPWKASPIKTSQPERMWEGIRADLRSGCEEDACVVLRKYTRILR